MLRDTLPPGAKLGSYEIVNALGSGGMGVVYRARDSKLKRDVAIKVLPDEFARDAAAVVRFQREAEALAALNHPNIGAIYDIGQSDESRFLVLELIEGETLADRISRGPIPIEDALAIGKQIADALEAAHEKGVIHRDLKPANVKLTPAGAAKVLDFGLAKTKTESTAALSKAPTLAASIPGVILGTAAYMSPEQAKGQETDRTSDIWSFGCVLYEMLTGAKAFDGQTIGEILAEVLKAEPNWQRLPANTPEAIRRLLLRCLRKDPKSRLRDIGDARMEIAEAQTAPAATGGAVYDRASFSAKERVVWIALAIIALLGGAAGIQFIKTPASPPETRVDIATTPTFSPSLVQLSPDSRQIAYVAEDGGRQQLWVRSLDSGLARVLPGTNNPSGLFWSPDNRSLGFFADNKLKVIDIERGSIRILANTPNSRGGAWNQKDVILFAPFVPGGLYRVSASGGNPELVTHQIEGDFHVWPQFLPDGEHFIFYVRSNSERNGVYVSSLSDPSKLVRLFDADSSAVYASSGYLFSLQKGRLMAQPFDAKRGTLNGNGFPVADQTAETGLQGGIPASASGSVVVYRGSEPADPHAARPHFAWFSREGRELEEFNNPLGFYVHWYLAPDGRSFAQERTNAGEATDVWRWDIARGVRNQVTNNPAADTFPVLSPNGQRVIFTSNRKGPTYDLYIGSVDRIGAETLLLESKENKIGTDWSADGRYLLYRNFSTDTGYDILALPLDENGNKTGEPISIVRTAADERDAQFSPDGKWVAYQSNDSGVFEIYVQPFPGPGAKYLVSTGGGSQVRWNRNGKELFYVALDGRLMSVPIRFDAGQHIEAGAPVPLFLTSLRGSEIQTGNRQQYAVSADGQRILMRADAPAPNTRPLTLILNWKPKP